MRTKHVWPKWIKFAFLVALFLLPLIGSTSTSPVSAGTLLEPSLGVTPNQGFPGITVTLNGSDYTPGPASILWNGAQRDTFTIPGSGSFAKSYIIPPGASVGAHTITVCWGSPCTGGDLYEGRDVAFTVLSPPTSTPPPPPPTSIFSVPVPIATLPPIIVVPPVGTFDVQVWAVEVTQGVRGNIPTRTPPDGDMILPPDGAVHVANRQTVVRVYPWVSVTDSTSVPPLTAQITGYSGTAELSGSPLSPETYFLIPDPGSSIDAMRRNEALSWNFILPTAWVQAGTIRLVVTVNPPGPDQQLECRGCDYDNIAELSGVQFTTVQTENIDMRINVIDFYYYDAAGAVINFQPTSVEISATINWWIKTWPIDPSRVRLSYRYYSISQNPPGYLLDAAGRSINQVSPPIPGAPNWRNQDFADDNTDIMEPAGILRPYAFLPMVFSPSSFIGCSGRAGMFGPPLFFTGACGSTFAQEAAHTLSRLHARGLHREDDGLDASYPGLHGQVEDFSFGFDVWDMRAIPPLPGGARHDFMSYGGSKWVSIYTWEALAGLYSAPTIEVGFAPLSENLQLASLSMSGMNIFQEQDDYLRISGDIDLDGTLYLDTAYTLSLPAGTGDYLGDGSHTIELLNQNEETLFTRQFEPTHTKYYDAWQFYEVVPVVEGLAQIIISQEETILANIPVSPNPPQVTLLSPTAGESWGADGQVTVSWQGSDPDGDNLLYRVQASPDGITWSNLYGSTPDTEALINLAYIPGSGEGWRVRVQISDGINVASDEVEDISIAPKPPIPTILNPLDGTFVSLGDSLQVFGTGYDYDEGNLTEAALEWLLDDETVASGAEATLTNLSEGQHTLTLQATNSQDISGQVSITIFVGQDTDDDGLPDTWELAFGLDPSNPGDAALDIDSDNLLAWQEFDYGTDPSLADTDGDSIFDGAEINMESDPNDPDSTPESYPGAEGVDFTGIAPSRGMQMSQDTTTGVEAQPPESGEVTGEEEAAPAKINPMLLAVITVVLLLIVIFGARYILATLRRS
ncbi:MAG: hypothetical protein FVQ83_02890 [Chloroflexi bacterium]|nr:hypothetical protein [Chloroflexota bacterium]